MKQANSVCVERFASQVVAVVAGAVCLLGVGCQEGSKSAERKTTQDGIAEQLLPDTPKDKRQAQFDRLLRAADLYDAISRASDSPMIAANALAARERVLRTRSGHIAQYPLAVYAVLVKRQGYDYCWLMTDVCVITRDIQYCELDIGLPKTKGNLLRIKMNSLFRGRTDGFRAAVELKVVLRPLEEVLARARPAAGEPAGVFEIVIDLTDDLTDPISVPDPGQHPTAFWAGTRDGRLSNSVEVTPMVYPTDPNTPSRHPITYPIPGHLPY